MEDYKDVMKCLIANYGEVSAWKIAGLFFGAKDLTETVDPLNPNNLKRAGFSAARNIMIAGKVPMKLPTQHSMKGVDKSPLSYDGTKLYDSILKKSIEASDFYSTIPIEVNVLLPTASGSVGLMVFPGCALSDNGNQCEFCILKGAKGTTPVNPEQVVKELSILYSIDYKPTNLTINTGQPMKKGDDLVNVGNVARKVKEVYPELPLAAEVGPFSFINQSDISHTLKDCGLDNIDTFMINVEMIKDSARKQLCPGKPSLDEYLSIIKKLTDLNYNVSTVLQLNFYPEMQETKDYYTFFKKLSEIGKGKAVPELLISRAVPGSRLEDPYWKDNDNSYSSHFLMYMMMFRFRKFESQLESIAMIYDEFGFDTSKFKAGCVKCGMCNVNDDVNNIKRRYS